MKQVMAYQRGNLSKGILAISLFVLALPAFADSKIGFVDAERVATESKAGKSAQQKLEGEFTKRLNDLKAMSKKVDDRRDEMTKSGSTWTDAQKRDKEREFESLARDFQTKQAQYQEDLNMRKREEFNTLADKINNIVKAMAEREKYDAIFQTAVYINPKLDVTNQIIKEMDK